MNLYISSEIFFWDEGHITGRPLDYSKQRRDYEIWEHAYGLSKKAKTKDERGDCITGLNRAVERRIKHLNEIYSLSYHFGSKHILDALEEIGLIRKFSLLKINNIRNFFVHRDTTPPSSKQLELLAESAWYFLKATDQPAYFPKDEVELIECESLEGAEYLLPDERPTVTLCLPAAAGQPLFLKDLHLSRTLYSESPVAHWIPVKAGKRGASALKDCLYVQEALLPKQVSVQLLKRSFSSQAF